MDGEISLIHLVIAKTFPLINFDTRLFYFGCNAKIKFTRIRTERKTSFSTSHWIILRGFCVNTELIERMRHSDQIPWMSSREISYSSAVTRAEILAFLALPKGIRVTMSSVQYFCQNWRILSLH